MALSERGHGLRECGIVFGLGQEFPGSPLLHDAEQFDLVMGLENQFLDESARDLLFDSSDRTVFINDSHSVASELTGQEFVVVCVRQGIDFLEGEVVELHQLHSWEGIHVHEGDTSRKLEGAIVLHVLLVVKHALPNRQSGLSLTLVGGNAERVVLVGIHEAFAE